MNTRLMTSNTLTTRQKLMEERQHLSRVFMKSSSSCVARVVGRAAMLLACKSESRKVCETEGDE